MNIADKANSTYWWRINLDTANPQNKPGLLFLLGYSKFQSQAEAINKIDCFCSKVEMLQKHGYIDKATSIEIFEKRGAFPCEQTDIKLIILYKKDFKINPELIGKIDHTIKEFLNKLYTIRNTGRPVENLRPLPEKIKKDDLYKYDAGKFPTAAALYTWCEKMIAGGENRQRVLSYYREYVLKNFSDMEKLLLPKK